MSRQLSALLLVLCCTIWSSCLFKRGAQKSQSPAGNSGGTDSSQVLNAPAVDTTSGPASSDVILWNQLREPRLAYETFAGKAHVNYDGVGNSQSFDVNIRLEKDRRIWVSVTALLGLEAARILITPDSLQAIDRLHRDVYSMRLSDAGQLLPFPADFQLLQSLILGEALPAGTSYAGMRASRDTAVLLGIGLFGKQELHFSQRDSILFRQRLSQEPNFMEVRNDRFDVIDGRKFPMIREIQASNAGMDHHVLMEFADVQFNLDLDMNFSIPSKYQRR